MNETNDITLKIVGLPKFNELDYYQYKYNEALKKMLGEPTIENAWAFAEWNRKLFEAEDCYRIGRRLLLQRSQQLQAI